jgi:HEAT repeat protein
MLASFDYKGQMELMKTSKEIPAFLLIELMCRLIHQDNIDQYVEQFFEFSDSWQCAILDVARDKNLRTEKLQDLLEQLMGSEDRELRVRALKTIASLGYLSSMDILHQMMDKGIKSAQWESPQAIGEKLMSARIMGNIRHENFLPVLMKLVSDRVYGIRSEAAKAIRQYKGGRDILLSIATTHSDSYARSISQEWMERSLENE